MSFYDKSSLLTIPTAYKQGKLYSVKPDDGSGDFTFARSTTGTRVNESGLIESVGVNVPRIDYSNGVPALLLEPQRTNLVLQSEDFGNYVNINSTDVANVTISPEGFTNATSFLEAATTGQHKLFTSFIFDGTSIYTFSIFAKHNGRDLFIDTQNSNEWGGRAWFDLTNGTANSILGTAAIEDFGNGWYRCIVTGISNIAGANFVELLTSDGSTSSTTGDITKGVYIYGCQLEEGAYATSYIPCYGAATTRSADMAEIIPLSTNIVDTSLAHTGFIEIKANAKGVVGYQVWGIDDGSYNNFIKLYIDSSLAKLRLAYRDSSGNINYSHFGNIGDYSKFAWTYDGVGEFKFYVDGVLTSTHSAVMNSFSTFGYGEKSGQTNYTNTSTKQIALFPTALTDAECITLTTI